MENSLQHDSFHCATFNCSQPFPTERPQGEGNYVGAIVSEKGTISHPCPYLCRPKERPEWIYC